MPPDVPPPPSPKPIKKKSALEIILTVLAVAIGWWAGSTLYSYAFHRSASVEEALSSSCAETNKKLPIMVDKETRLDSESADPNRVFHYRYTLINYTTDQVSPAQIQSLLQPHIRDTYRTSPDMAYFRDNGVSLLYDYSDAKGNHITNIEVGPADLKTGDSK